MAIGGERCDAIGERTRDLRRTRSTRWKLGPRGVPGGKDSAKMTPEQEKNILKEGEFDGRVA